MSIVLEKVCAGYSDFQLKDISLTLKKGSFTALIGPNGCGKSTLLNAISRVIPLRSGSICIEGKDLSKTKNKQIAKMMAMLPQHPVVPSAISVEQLVGYGRAPHQNLLGIRSKEDIEFIEQALEKTALIALRNKRLSELSGGQRQRAFIAMCLAQDTGYLLFDEPTSFLDIRYQFETLELLADLKSQGRSCVVVLHDIMQAARYADDLVIMRDGEVKLHGEPSQVLTESMLKDIYDINAKVYADPVTGTPALSFISG
ncbi:MAG: FhuC protein [Osedax symbiont Rs1]|nr:MAG: FhuC protein [Osedax symbiont Rs1]